MPSAPETTKASRTGTRERILDAACACFARSGRDGVSMRELSARTRLTMPTLYHHFGDKSALYAACVAHVLDSAAQELRDAWRTADTPANGLRAFTEAMCRQLLHHPALLAFLHLESVYGDDPLQRLVPPGLRRDIDAAAAGPDVGEAMPLGASARLIACAFGYAVVARASPGGRKKVSARDMATLVEGLLRASGIVPAAT